MKYRWQWLTIFAGIIADGLTTYAGLNLGVIKESNPIIRLFIESYDLETTIIGGVLFRICMMGFVIWPIEKFHLPHHKKFIYFLMAFHVFVPIWNLFVIIIGLQSI